VGFLRKSDSSKNLLLRRVICDDNLANNGGILNKSGTLITIIDLVL
jgi:hypothetical protein